MNIGSLRRSLFMEYDCQWNSLVRDITAKLERENEEVDEHKTHILLLTYIKAQATLDHNENTQRRLLSVFAESK